MQSLLSVKLTFDAGSVTCFLVAILFSKVLETSEKPLALLKRTLHTWSLFCCSLMIALFFFYRYTGCIGGCDDNLRELLDLKDLTRLPSESGKSSIQEMFFFTRSVTRSVGNPSVCSKT